MRQVDGLREDDVKAIVSARDGIPAELNPHLFAPPPPSPGKGEDRRGLASDVQEAYLG